MSEKDYIDENTNGKGVKRKIQELFVNDNASIAAQIDKNTSAIYPIKLESLNNLDKYRNLIYSVEESPHYFRRFVLPYTDKQVDELKIIISDYPEKNIVNILSEIANQEEAYYELAGHRNLDNAYELVIRLFSKIPFLQYNFVAQQKPMAVEKRIESEMDAEFLKYHTLISKNCVDIDEYIKVLNLPEDDAAIEAEMKKRLEKRG